jgi:HEPN domain-containing protein
MNKQKAITYWFNMADYDLKTAQVMLDGRRYLYVGFMCHQIIEEALKGLCVKQHNKIPPYTHNLLTLCADLNLDLTKEQQDFFAELNPLNIEARYPEMKEKLGTAISKKKASILLEDTGHAAEIFMGNKSRHPASRLFCSHRSTLPLHPHFLFL